MKFVKFNIALKIWSDDCQAVEKAQDLLSELVRVYQFEVNEIVRLEREKNL